MPDIDLLLTHLNERQKEAVLHHETPLLVLAGAGSGKTRVITYKIANLLVTGAAQPHQILAITFTNKAAEEMSKRVAKTLQADLKSLWIKTFHSCALMILRSHITELGYSREFTIYDELDRKRFVKECLERANLDKETYPPDDLITKISLRKNTLQPESALFDDENEIRLYHLYEELKRKLNILDFDDILEKCVELFRTKPEIREKYKQRWKFILVDEYQDVNPLQYEFIRCITDRKSPITVVGDDDQSIYGWRGASPEHVFKFEHDFDDVRIVVLDQNYRSTSTIITAASHLITHNVHRKQKRLWTENPKGEQIELITASNAFQEADAVLHKIQVMRKEGVAYSDMAVFYRTNYQSQMLENALIKHKVPYQIIGGLKFFERAEIKDILAYLKVLINPMDDVNLKRIINVPQRAIGETSIRKASEEALTLGVSLYQVISQPSADVFGKSLTSKFQAFVSQMEKLRKMKEHATVAEVVDQVVKETGYVQYLEKKPIMEREGRIRNVEEFIQLLLQKVKESPDLSLEEYVSELSLYTAVDALDQTHDKLNLITLHNAKGLEFPVVFIIGLEENLLPHKNSYESGTIDEERRLFYVGITRARKKLFLLHAAERMMYGQPSSNAASRFLSELPGELLHATDMFLPPERGPVYGVSIKSKKDFPDTNGFRQGDIVRHPDYGIGSVRQVYGEGDDAVVVVRFEVGEKKLISRFSKLSKI